MPAVPKVKADLRHACSVQGCTGLRHVSMCNQVAPCMQCLSLFLITSTFLNVESASGYCYAWPEL